MAQYKVSVVLATYNGEKFIEEQLHSLFVQTRPADEVLIFDDCSSDNTVKIINSYIDENKITNWKLIENKTNQGWKKNFINGFHEVTGDIIFCADQDDIWDCKKIELMTNVMELHSNINVLACNLEPLYESGGENLAQFYINPYGETKLACVDIKEYGLTVLRPGCTICFRKSLIAWIDRIWNEQLAHDETIWALGVVTQSLYIYNEALILFRRHGKNNSPSNKKRAEIRIHRMDCELNKIKSILQSDELFCVDNGIKKYLCDLEKFLDRRREALVKKSFFRVFELAIYMRFYSSFKNWIADFVCVIGGEKE